MTEHPSTGYKVLTASEMATLERDGGFAGSPVDLADGFVHLSTAAQLTETVDRHFAGAEGLHVVAIDLVALGSAVHWEVSRNGELFPHLYAPLRIDTVIARGPLERGETGEVRPPAPG